MTVDLRVDMNFCHVTNGLSCDQNARAIAIAADAERTKASWAPSSSSSSTMSLIPSTISAVLSIID